MFLMITIILSILVAINFALLRFSCNKTNRKQTAKPFVINKPASTLTTQSASGRLAATGS